MKPVDPAEISALLDGELSPERSEQVRRSMAESSELRGVFEELTAVHRDLAADAVAARFRPRLALPKRTKVSALSIVGFTTAMLVLRLTAKLAPVTVGGFLHAVALVIVLWWVCSRLLRIAVDEGRQFVGTEAPGIT
jgi:anti-sigma factor RsiW